MHEVQVQELQVPSERKRFTQHSCWAAVTCLACLLACFQAEVAAAAAAAAAAVAQPAVQERVKAACAKMVQPLAPKLSYNPVQYSHSSHGESKMQDTTSIWFSQLPEFQQREEAAGSCQFLHKNLEPTGPNGVTSVLNSRTLASKLNKCWTLYGIREAAAAKSRQQPRADAHVMTVTMQCTFRGKPGAGSDARQLGSYHRST
jgi:hypothetical protein